MGDTRTLGELVAYRTSEIGRPPLAPECFVIVDDCGGIVCVCLNEDDAKGVDVGDKVDPSCLPVRVVPAMLVRGRG